MLKIIQPAIALGGQYWSPELTPILQPTMSLFTGGKGIMSVKPRN